MLVDDNKLTLDGYAAVLSSHPAIALVAAFDHDKALREEEIWHDVDVVILDAADEGRVGDQFPGVKVVRHIRSSEGDSRSIIVVVTGHFFDDGLRRRMADADADFFFLRPEIRSPEKLIDIVMSPQRYRRGVPPVSDSHDESGMGVTDRSRVDEFVEYVEQYGLEAMLDARERTPQGRRSLLRHRKAIAREAQIETVNITTGDLPSAAQRGPSLRQLRKIWAWAARVKYPPRDDSHENEIVGDP